jgi:hypothetical protein
VYLSRAAKSRITVAAVVASSFAALAIPAGAASSSTTTSPAEGRATSSLTLLQVKLAGTTVAAGRIAAVSNNISDPNVAKLVVTPVTSSETGPIGQQTVTPDSGDTTVPGTPKSVDLPSGLGSITGPTFRVSAADTASAVLTSAVLKALGSVTIVTVPLDLQAASLVNVSKVTADRASARKAVTVGGLALPSLNDLLASLGVDLDALLDQLTQGKLNDLAGLVTSTTKGAVGTANDAVDAAQAAVSGTVPKTLDDAQAGLTGAQSALTTAQGALTTATNAFDTAFAAIPAAGLGALGVPTDTTAAEFLALAPALQSSVDALTGADLSALATAVQAAEDAVTAAQAAVDELQALVTALTDLITAVLDALAANDDPLAALGDIEIATSAIAAKTPTADAAVNVGSVEVLGATTPVAQLTGVLGDVTDTLSGVLESVAGVSFTAPTIAVGTPSHSTDQQGRTRYAKASITGVTLTLPSITLPAALSLPGVPTDVTGSVTLGQLAETAQWTPATAQTTAPGTPAPGTPTGGSPLPDTGGRMLLSLAGLLVFGAALALRRFGRRTVADA